MTYHFVNAASPMSRARVRACSIGDARNEAYKKDVKEFHDLMKTEGMQYDLWFQVRVDVMMV